MVQVRRYWSQDAVRLGDDYVDDDQSEEIRRQED